MQERRLMAHYNSIISFSLGNRAHGKGNHLDIKPAHLVGLIGLPLIFDAQNLGGLWK